MEMQQFQRATEGQQATTLLAGIVVFGGAGETRSGADRRTDRVFPHESTTAVTVKGLSTGTGSISGKLTLGVFLG